MTFAPPTWLVTIAGMVAAAIAKQVFDAWVAPHFGPTARLKRAEKAEDKLRAERASVPSAARGSPFPAPAGAALAAVKAPPLDLQLLGKEVELQNIKSELADAQNGCVILQAKLVTANRASATSRALSAEIHQITEDLERLRASNDRMAFEMAELSGKLAAERELNRQLNEENARLRREGGDTPPRPPRAPQSVPKQTVDPRFAIERLRGTNPGEAVRVDPTKGTKAGV